MRLDYIVHMYDKCVFSLHISTPQVRSESNDHTHPAPVLESVATIYHLYLIKMRKHFRQMVFDHARSADLHRSVLILKKQ